MMQRSLDKLTVVVRLIVLCIQYLSGVLATPV